MTSRGGATRRTPDVAVDDGRARVSEHGGAARAIRRRPSVARRSVCGTERRPAAGRGRRCSASMHAARDRGGDRAPKPALLHHDHDDVLLRSGLAGSSCGGVTIANSDVSCFAVGTSAVPVLPDDRAAREVGERPVARCPPRSTTAPTRPGEDRSARSRGRARPCATALGEGHAPSRASRGWSRPRGPPARGAVCTSVPPLANAA